jgi:ssDNA-binding Zn-finger/Zn-ribbon topoisomerase 1
MCGINQCPKCGKNSLKYFWTNGKGIYYGDCMRTECGYRDKVPSSIFWKSMIPLYGRKFFSLKPFCVGD